MGLRWSEARKAIMSIPGSRLSLLLIHRRMNRTVVCLRHSNVRETMAIISPAVHKQTHIEGISFLLRRMVADEAGYIGLSRTVCKDTCVTSQVWVLLKEGFTERFRPASALTSFLILRLHSILQCSHKSSSLCQYSYCADRSLALRALLPARQF